MKKKNLIAVIGLMLLCGTVAFAQNKGEDKRIFNHVGVNVGAGTEGIGVGVAAPCTDFLEFGFDVNIVPSIKIKSDISVNSITTTSAGGASINLRDASIEGSFARTTFNFKANCYPFGRHSSFFVAAGLSFGGDKLLGLNGHSDDIKDYLTQHPEMKGRLVGEIDKYNVVFSDNGDIAGDVRVKAVRPYVGLGFGRLVPKHRVGCRFELGCQFMGKAQIYQNGEVVKTSDSNDVNDDISKIVEKITVYPVLKLSIATRIF